MQELVLRINLVSHMLQEKLEKYQKLYIEVLEEEKRIERETKEQMISKIFACVLVHILFKRN